MNECYHCRQRASVENVPSASGTSHLGIIDIQATTKSKYYDHIVLLYLESRRCRYRSIIIPSPTKLRRDIVTLRYHPSFRNIPVNTLRINILQWNLTKLGTYLVLKRIWNPIDFKGQGHRVQFLLHNILMNTLESTSFNGL